LVRQDFTVVPTMTLSIAVITILFIGVDTTGVATTAEVHFMIPFITVIAMPAITAPLITVDFLTGIMPPIAVNLFEPDTEEKL
jgi:hypothetical protein